MMESWNVRILFRKVIPLILFILSRKITVIPVHAVRKSFFSKIANQKSKTLLALCLAHELNNS